MEFDQEEDFFCGVEGLNKAKCEKPVEKGERYRKVRKQSSTLNACVKPVLPYG